MDRRAILFWAGFLFLALALALQATTDGTRSGELTLLTVADTPDGAHGGTATVRLDVRPGNGAILIDSFPLTRLDTQASTRYAQQVACDHLGIDCSRYDFAYTIRANTAVVGGPSAGGAIAVLTAAVLEGLPLDHSIAMTGTINSGGVIGPVAGVRAKIDGARRAGIKKVLIPVLTGPQNETFDANATPDISSVPQLGPLPRGPVPSYATKEVDVEAVGTLDEAIAAFTGRVPPVAAPAPIAPPEYAHRMRAIGDGICGRNFDLKAELAMRHVPYDDPNNYTRRIAAVPLDDGYARASLCFSQDIEIRQAIMNRSNEREREALLADTLDRLGQVENATLATPIATVGDLEIAAIVRERTTEARKLLATINASSENGSVDLAYANERVRSAQSWSALFGMPGAPIHVDEDRLRRACLAKIAEADERINYVRVYAPSAVAGAQAELTRAYESDDDPVLCILHGAKATADANLIAEIIAVQPSGVDALVREKLAAGQLVLSQRQANGGFPILGYSYWRYAQLLRPDAPYSALTFAEQSLELSTLDMYFPREPSRRLPPDVALPIVFFSYGVAFCVAGALLLWPVVERKKPKRR